MTRAGCDVRNTRHLGETVHHRRFSRLPAIAFVLALIAGGIGGGGPALADPAAAPPAAAEAAGAQETAIAPLPDLALPGAYCLAGTAAAMVAVFAAGPTESLMILSGAMHLPTGTAVLFVPLMSILGGSACAIAAASQPAVSWAIEQSDNIAAQVGAAGRSVFADRSDLPPAGPGGKDNSDDAVPAVRPLTEGETQSVGCVAGALAGFGAAMATSPMEVAMLSSGANTVVSTTPILALGLLGTIVVSGCGIGTYAILPIQAFVNNFSTIGDSLLDNLSQIGNAVSEGANRMLALVKGAPPAIKVADGAAAH